MYTPGPILDDIQLGSKPCFDLSTHSHAQDLNELRIHVSEFVRDIQDFDRRKFEILKTRGQSELVLAFHHDAEVLPQKVLFANAVLRVCPHPTRTDFKPLVLPVQTLSGRAALPVHRTHEENS